MNPARLITITVVALLAGCAGKPKAEPAKSPPPATVKPWLCVMFAPVNIVVLNHTCTITLVADAPPVFRTVTCTSKAVPGAAVIVAGVTVSTVKAACKMTWMFNVGLLAMPKVRPEYCSTPAGATTLHVIATGFCAGPAGFSTIVKSCVTGPAIVAFTAAGFDTDWMPV